MNKLMIGCLLLMALLPSLAAQQREEGIAFCYAGVEADSLYATHQTHPFGAKLIIINPVNKAAITVQVGGRPNPATSALVEISQEAAGKLGIFGDIPTWVWVEAEKQAAAKEHVMRPRLGVFKQHGNAVPQSSGNELTASHTSLPIGSKIKVTRGNNARAVTLTITNRIRASKERIIEISLAAAQALGIRGASEVFIETTEN
jgi:rare lipoprotein A (peptidoglycan hydrolase)